jgi:nitrous oxidase accessory protein
VRSLLTILFLSLVSLAEARTIIVGKDQVITSVRKAVELARDRDTILLRSGIYKEGNIIIT